MEVGPNVLLTQFLRNYHELQIELAGLNNSIESLDREVNKKGIPVIPMEMEVHHRTSILLLFLHLFQPLQVLMTYVKAPITIPIPRNPE